MLFHSSGGPVTLQLIMDNQFDWMLPGDFCVKAPLL